MKKLFVLLFSTAFLAGMAGCGSSQANSSPSSSSSSGESKPTMSSPMPGSASRVPLGIKVARHPRYKVGSSVTIKASHMSGMKNAKGTVAGAYTTNVYSVTYKPVNGGPWIKNHKWVVQEELVTNKKGLLKKGTRVKLNASHMPGMKGATATIETSRHGHVYMVNYKDTKTGQWVKHHKWVTEDELEAR
ncbi:DUF1541 domain-containing protein [Sporolactobacillus sp. THM7-4]|nr:DUF1541 domain-containing protein [Sporolactobacillus sp. THM7-4]